MNYCKIESGVVVNVAVFDSAGMPDGWAEPGSVWVQNDEAAIGWAYSAGAFTPPEVAPAAPLDPVTAGEVKAEATRRFMAISASARAMKDVLDTPIPADIVALSEAIIAKGNEIASMTPIPQDYAADERWPTAYR